MSSPAVQPLLALLASHVGGNPTQYMFEQAFVHHNLDWRYMTFEVEPENLGDAIRGLRALGFRGGHCADPHKQAALNWLDRITETAQLVGSVNLIYREENALIGDNTEGKGALRTLRTMIDPAGKRIVLCGAGRAARAIAVELAAADVAALTIVNRTESHAVELVAMLADQCNVPIATAPWLEEYCVPPDADILIHAARCFQPTCEAPLPLDADSLRPELLVADMTADSPRTWLLAEAEQRGCRTIDGLSIFIEQAAMGFMFWTGVDPNRQVLREAVEEFLEL